LTLLGVQNSPAEGDAQIEGGADPNQAENGLQCEAQLRAAIFLKNKFGRKNYRTSHEAAFLAGQEQIFDLLSSHGYVQWVMQVSAA